MTWFVLFCFVLDFPNQINFVFKFSNKKAKQKESSKICTALKI